MRATTDKKRIQVQVDRHLALTNAFKGLPAKDINTDQELEDWINESEE
ncbi:hypothetical protein PT287_01950 [Lactobacillus sp. ESL0679]|nr:hypothetical protein [Lactobacillus sp. ESL0679]MDF7682285.1 hypothetical protein [Lactobacillus sp. ESL0679]